MKRILYTILLAIGTLSFSSCTDYINVDKYFYDQVSLDSAFSKRVYVDGWLSSAYSVMDYIGEYREPFRWASDDLYHPDMKDYVEGNYSADNQLSDKDQNESRLWKYYEGIRKASTFIQNVDRCSELTMDEIADMKGQARFLRAYCYWALIRVYGPVPLIPLEGLDVNLSYEELSLPREHFDNLVDFIDQELAESARSLPTKRTVNNLGRPTRGAALGLRSRVLLYAASPLFNGNTDQASVKNKDGKQLFPQTEDNSKWAQARDAYERFMTFATGQGYKLTEVYTNGKLDPYASCRAAGEFFTTTWEAVDELIFVKLRDLYDYTYWVCPKFTDFQDTDVTGGGGYYTTQETVDLFFTKDGLTIEEDPGYDKFEGIPSANNFTSGRYYDPNNPSRLYFDADKSKVLKQWKDRELRFYVNITYSGSIWLNEGKYNEEMRTDFTNGANGTCGKSKASGDCPDSGYLIRRGAKASNNNGSKHFSPVLRLADMYLGYAEALCMCSDLDNALTYLNKIRVRAGIPEYTFTATAGKITCPKTQTDLLNRIRRERLVELVFEWNRYFDVRRWKVAEGQNDPEHWIYPAYHTGGEGGKVYGMNMDKDYPAFFERTSFETRVAFTKKQYFMPIPYDDLRRIPSLVQNLGW